MDCILQSCYFQSWYTKKMSRSGFLFSFMFCQNGEILESDSFMSVHFTTSRGNYCRTESYGKKTECKAHMKVVRVFNSGWIDAIICFYVTIIRSVSPSFWQRLPLLSDFFRFSTSTCANRIQLTAWYPILTHHNKGKKNIKHSSSKHSNISTTKNDQTKT